MLQHMALKQRNTQAILEQAERNPAAETKLLAQSGELIRGLDDNNAARILYHLADRYYRTGRWSMAAETFQLLADRYPQHPLARPALLWLMQYYCKRRSGMARTVDAKNTRDNKPRPPDSTRRNSKTAWVVPRPWANRSSGPGRTFRRAVAAISPGRGLAESRRGYGRPNSSTRSESHSADRDAWSACAQGEIWLADPKGKQPKPSQRCWKAASQAKIRRPAGRCNLAKNRIVPLKSALNDDEQWPAVVAFAYDAEFLYHRDKLPACARREVRACRGSRGRATPI